MDHKEMLCEGKDPIHLAQERPVAGSFEHSK